MHPHQPSGASRQVLQCHIYTAVERARHNAPASVVRAESGVTQGGGLFDGSEHVAMQDLELLLPPLSMSP